MEQRSKRDKNYADLIAFIKKIVRNFIVACEKDENMCILVFAWKNKGDASMINHNIKKKGTEDSEDVC